MTCYYESAPKGDGGCGGSVQISITLTGHEPMMVETEVCVHYIALNFHVLIHDYCACKITVNAMKVIYTVQAA